MKRIACEHMADMLVDYADGELPPAQRQVVADHLRACERCRATLAALERSLGLAQVVWKDAAHRPAERRRRVRHVPAIAMAAGVVLLVLGWLAWLAIDDRRRNVVTTQPGAADENTVIAHDMPGTSDVLRQIEQAGAAAELLAAADILAEEPEARDLAREQYRLMMRLHGGTRIGDEAAARLNRM